jgi:hypothetical protein
MITKYFGLKSHFSNAAVLEEIIFMAQVLLMLFAGSRSVCSTNRQIITYNQSDIPVKFFSLPLEKK